jgi:hypothetical protein
MGLQSIPYTTLRFAPSFSYSFPLPAGQYTVTLDFLEPNKSGPGQRVFTVSVAGAAVLPNLDLFAVAGLLTPYSKSFPAAVAAGVPLKISFLASAGNAVVSAIQIDSIDPPPAAAVGIVSSQLLDFAAAETSSTVRTFGASCTAATPCIAGPLARSFTHGFTATLAPFSGLGSALVYLDPLTGDFTVSGLAVDCPGCLTPAGVSAFPPGATLLYRCTASNGAWDVGGCQDMRRFLPPLASPALAPFPGHPYMTPLQSGPDSVATVPGSVHGVAPPCALDVRLFDDAVPSNPIPQVSAGPGWRYTINRATCDVTVIFEVPWTNYYVLILGSWVQGPALLALEGCSGSLGTSNCAGVVRARVMLGDGSLLTLAAVPGDSYSSWNQWAAVK